MTKITTNHGALKTVSWHADMPLLTKPKIRKRFKVVEGVKYYLGLKGKEYRAMDFDKFWGSATI